MLDNNGIVLTFAQTWHRVRVRNNCGGCHAHSQQPLNIANTFAGRPDYKPVDLTELMTYLTKNTNGATVAKTNPPGPMNVEFLRDIRPVLQRSCVRVRFRVQPAVLRITKLEPTELASRRVTLRFENPSGRTDQVVYASDGITRPANAWTPVTILSNESEPDLIRRLEVQLPVSFSSQCFLRVAEP